VAFHHTQTAHTPLSYKIPALQVGSEAWGRLEGCRMRWREETVRRAEGPVLESLVEERIEMYWGND